MKDGIFNDISIEDYHADREYDSATTLKWAKKSLAEYAHMRSIQSQQPTKRHLDFGNCFELALLNPVSFAEKVGIAETEMWTAHANNEELKKSGKAFDKVRSSGSFQKAQKEFLAANTGKYIINDTGEQSYETITRMLESIYKDATIQQLIKGVEYQLSLFWHDDQTGLGLKTRPDFCKRKRNVLVNVKTIDDGSPASFSKELAKWDYPFQAAVEIRGAVASGLMPSVDNYFWLVCEKKPPYNATIYEFGRGDIDAMDIELDYVLGKLKKAKTTNVWPGYTEFSDNKYGILTAQLPGWYKTPVNPMQSDEAIKEYNRKASNI